MRANNRKTKVHNGHANVTSNSLVFGFERTWNDDHSFVITASAGSSVKSPSSPCIYSRH